jgi:AbrB family looped-hinge helix DNA binding protein
MLTYYTMRIDGDNPMKTVKISPKFQVVIPKDIRQSMKLRAGARLAIIKYAGRIELLPLRPMRELRGSLRGIDTDVPRDEDRA